jgi:hypothetical protein
VAAQPLKKLIKTKNATTILADPFNRIEPLLSEITSNFVLFFTFVLSGRVFLPDVFP